MSTAGPDPAARLEHGEGLPPLEPFLRSLEGSGIRCGFDDHVRIHRALRADADWDLPMLRATLVALLAQTPAQIEELEARFDDFFPALAPPGREPSPGPTEGGGDARRRPDLETAQERWARLEAERQQRERDDAERRRQRRQSRIGVAVAVALLVVLGLVTRQTHTWPWPVDDERVTPTPTPTGSTDPSPARPLSEVGDSGSRIYSSPPAFGARRVIDARGGSGYAIASGALLLLAGGWVGALRWRRRPAEVSPPSVDLDHPARFEPAAAGGPPPGFLTREDLDYLGERIGTFSPEELTDDLDLDSTIDETSRAGGQPQLVFEREREDRTVVLLEDAYAATRAWNRTARELAAGLDARRVPVLHGEFHGTPVRFVADGRPRHLAQLATEARRYLVLVWSDAAHLRAADLPELRPLAALPRVAWIDPREPRFWDAGSVLPTELGIPLFPGTRAGVMAALLRLLPGPRARADYSALARRRWGRALRGGTLEADLEEVLGSALPWARACAMVQPISLALAQELRGRHFTATPPEAIGRCYELRGTAPVAGGFRLSAPSLAILRRGFREHEPESRQVEILETILRWLERHQPPRGEARTLARLAWEKAYYRVLLELDPDRAAQPLAELGASPVGPGLRAELAQVVAPGDGTPGDAGGGGARVPLRRLPRSIGARRRLRALFSQSSHGLGSLPVRPWQHAVTAALLLALLASGALGLRRYLGGAAPTIAVRTDAPDPAGVVILERIDDRGPNGSGAAAVTVLLAASPDQIPIEAATDYRAWLYRDGHFAFEELQVERGRRLELSLTSGAERVEPCREQLPRPEAAAPTSGNVPVAIEREEPAAEVERVRCLPGSEDSRPSRQRVAIVAPPPPARPSPLRALDPLLSLLAAPVFAEAPPPPTPQPTPPPAPDDNGAGTGEHRLPSWRATAVERMGDQTPAGRTLSIGIEIGTTADPYDFERMAPLYRALLESGSVDWIVRAPVRLPRAWESERIDELPRSAETQWLWWSVAGDAVDNEALARTAAALGLPGAVRRDDGTAVVAESQAWARLDRPGDGRWQIDLVGFLGQAAEPVTSADLSGELGREVQGDVFLFPSRTGDGGDAPPVQQSLDGPGSGSRAPRPSEIAKILEAYRGSGLEVAPDPELVRELLATDGSSTSIIGIISNLFTSEPGGAGRLADQIGDDEVLALVPETPLRVVFGRSQLLLRVTNSSGGGGERGARVSETQEVVAIPYVDFPDHRFEVGTPDSERTRLAVTRPDGRVLSVYPLDGKQAAVLAEICNQIRSYVSRISRRASGAR